jgi:hypothetical protein
MAVETAWWRKDKVGLVYIPVGTKGTIRRFPMPWGHMWGVEWDGYPHPKRGGFCGMSEREGNTLPGFAARIARGE